MPQTNVRLPDMTASEKVYLGVGGNFPETSEALASFKSKLERQYNGVRHSSIYETQPYQSSGGSPYLNMCSCAEVPEVDPLDFLKLMLAWELELGRVRKGQKWEPRLIDIDVLIFGGQTVNESGVVIPHYDLANRDFFLIPLLEIASDLIIPSFQMTPSELLQAIPEKLRTNPVRAKLQN